MSRGRRAAVLQAVVLALWLGGCASSEAPRDPSAAQAEAHGTLAHQRDPGDTERLTRDTKSDLAVVDRILAEAGDDTDPATLRLVRDLADRARSALAQDDLERARNLAKKARTLAEDL